MHGTKLLNALLVYSIIQKSGEKSVLRHAICLVLPKEWVEIIRKNRLLGLNLKFTNIIHKFRDLRKTGLSIKISKLHGAQYL